MKEFELIERYWGRPILHAERHPLANGDDAALTTIPHNHALVTSLDTLVVGRHFLTDTNPEDIGYKSLAVSLSDMAAMGANPLSLLLGLTLPAVDSDWLASFRAGLDTLLDLYNMDFIGGDTTQGPLSITTVVNGLVPTGQALTRSGAKIGDDIYVSGQLGNAAKATELLLANAPCPAAYLTALNRPTPRIDLGIALRGIATSAIDISDGLASDLPHILKASNCGANINETAIPTTQDLTLALTGGDDYELCFTANPNQRAYIQTLSKQLNLPLTKIGSVRSQGQPFDVHLRGYQHFSDHTP